MNRVKNMRKQWFLRSAALLVAIGAPSLALSAQTVRTALPGTVNYVEGQVSIDGRSLSAKQDGNTQLQPNQTLSTQNGKAEILLTPGTFVRAGNNSEIRMVSTGLVAPTIEVVRGEAMVEVDQKPKEAEVDVLEHGATASILKEGLYSFHSDEGKIEVIDGKVKVTENGGSKEFGRGKEVVLNGEPLKTHEQPARPHSIPISQVVERYRNLNQSLQEGFLAARGLQPGFLKRLVALKEFPVVKQIDSVEQKLLLVSGQWRRASWCGVAVPRAGTPAQYGEGIETAGRPAASLTPATEGSCESRKAPAPSGRRHRACRRYCGGGSLRSAR